MSTENEVILSLQNVTKRYPGVTALDHVSMEFRKGEVHALLGENGAGKSTLIKTITGANSIDEGSIVFEGTKYAGLTTSLSRDLGISAVYQESNLIRQMTVADNIFLGDYATRNYFTDDAAMKKKAKEVLASLGFHIDPGTKALVLTAAQQQIIEIARPLVRNLKLIIFDEPTSALSSAEADQLFEIIEMLKKKGITVIYITHRIEELFRIADRVSIMRDGCYIDTVNIKDVKRDTLISLMVGREFVESYPKPKGSPGEVIMEAKHLEGDKFHDISFQVRAGEILGFAGLVGSGRTETARGVFGADRLKAGEVYMKGKKVTSRTPKEGIRNGIGYIPEERKEQGLFLHDSICHNASIASIGKYSLGGFVNRKKEKETVNYFCRKMRVKAPDFNELVFNLSGGNQQKVLVAKWLATQCDVLIFDEPTRGIDVEARHEIYELMREMADEGKAIILISSDMLEIIGLSDRVEVFYEGRVTGTLVRGELDQVQIMRYASGENDKIQRG